MAQSVEDNPPPVVSQQTPRYPVDLGLYLGDDSVVFELWPKKNSGKGLDFWANTPTTLAMDWNINGYGVSADIYQNNGGIADEDFGKTRYQRFKFNKYFKKTGLDFYYARSAGVYLDHSDAFDDGSQWVRKKSVLYRPDVSLYSFGFNVFHVSDPVSVPFEVGLNLRDFPHEPGWSMLYFVSHDTLAISASSSLIPESHQEYFAELQDFDGGMFAGLIGGVGIGGVVPWGPFLIGGTASLGILSIAFAQYNDGSAKVAKGVGYAKGNIRLIAGYHIQNYFFKVFGYLDQKSFGFEGYTAAYQTNFVAFGVSRSFF